MTEIWTTHHLLIRHGQHLIVVVFLRQTEVHRHAHRHAHVHRVATEQAVALQLALLAQRAEAEVSAAIKRVLELLILGNSPPALARRVHTSPSTLCTTRT